MRLWNWIKRLFRKKQTTKPRPIEPVLPVGDFVPAKYINMYNELWDTMQIRMDKLSTINWYTKQIIKNRERYEKVAGLTNVPWELIGCLHLMEGSGDFKAALHNGDLVIGNGRKTYRVPAGRGPFDSWEESAIDALSIKSQPKKWGIVETLYYAERWNGLGYLRDPNKPNSPFLWSMSNHYIKGKYTRDSYYDPNAVSKQCGLALVLRELGYRYDKEN